MRSLRELEELCMAASEVHNLEQFCAQVANAEQALEAKQDELRMLRGANAVGAAAAAVGLLEQLVCERDALRQECHDQNSCLLTSTNAEELGRLLRLWHSHLEATQGSLDLWNSAAVRPFQLDELPAQELDGQTELERVREQGHAAATKIEALRVASQRCHRAEQDSDLAAKILAAVLSSTSSHLCGAVPTFSDISISDASDKLLAAIEAERAIRTEAEVAQSFPADLVLSFGQALWQLCQVSIASIRIVETACLSASQVAANNSELCSSAEACEKLSNLADLRKEQLQARTRYQRAKQDLESEWFAGNYAETAKKLEGDRQDLLCGQRLLELRTSELAAMAYSACQDPSSKH